MTEQTVTRRRPSAFLLLAGLLALAISIWSLVGPDTWAGGFPFGWVLVIGAIAVGTALLRSPKRT